MSDYSDASLRSLSEKLARQLLADKARLVTAESCTGGWLAKCCTDIAGSSAWFQHGIVSYSNAAKQRLLKVSASTLAKHGAVSEATALEMAIGALADGDATLSVAITGIAGPDGGSSDKPVGTVCFAWASTDGSPVSCRKQFPGDREHIRRQAVVTALQGLLDYSHSSNTS